MAERIAASLTIMVSMVVAMIYLRWNAEPIKLDDSVSATDPTRRSAFIGRVYSIVLLQLATTAVAATCVVAAIVPEDDQVFGFEGNSVRHKAWKIATSTPVYCAAIVLSFVLLCLLFTHRKDPHSSLQLFEAFALVEGYFIGLACARVPKAIVAHAVGLTFLTFGVLTLLAFHLTNAGADLGFLQPFLAEALAMLIWSRLCSWCFGYEWEEVAAAGAGALLFSVYIIFDTNQIIKKYADDEYVAAAANLYLDVVNLFLELLEELGKSQK
jgi:FtsH-binding integral membrane protein